MTNESSHESWTEEDRVVSRRVDNPTSADEGDERAYRAADPAADPSPDLRSGGGGSIAERADRDLDADDESEPTRSE